MEGYNMARFPVFLRFVILVIVLNSGRMNSEEPWDLHGAGNPWRITH